MTSILELVLGQALSGVFLVYTALMLAHLAFQVTCAELNRRRSARRPPAARHAAGSRPSVDVVVPVYHEDPADLAACCAAILDQDYAGEVSVYLVDDGSPNIAALEPVYATYGARPGWHVLRQANAGKRAAQDKAVRRGTGALVVTIDSDTQINRDGIRTIVDVFRDRRIGAVTGDVRVANAGRNLLTRLIDMRYWVAFHQERAAQSWFGSVLCCSGPFAVYRRDVLHRVWDRYVRQTFRRVECTYGDDRHLTNLVVAEGFRTVFEPRAGAVTSAPTTLRQYLRQQLRWNKSYYRELLWTLCFLPRLAVYMSFEVVVQTLLPLLLVGGLVSTAVRSVEHPAHLLTYVATLSLTAVAHCLYAMWRTRDPRFLLFVLYGFLHVALLVPVRLRALATLTDSSWGTRTGAPVAALAPSARPLPMTTA